MESLMEQIWTLSPEQYTEFMVNVHLQYPQRSKDLTNRICNKWKNEETKMMKRQVASGPGRKPVSSATGHVPNKERQEVDGAVARDGHTLEDASGTGSNLLSSAPKPWQTSAWKTGFIFRGDKVPSGGNLFLDVEKVTLRKVSKGEPHKQVAATVCLVNEDGKVVLWAFIKIPHTTICQYSPKITNLNQFKLGIGVDIEMVRACMKICTAGNTIVGAAVKNDLESLGFTHSRVFDLQSVFFDEKGPFALGLIIKQLMSNRTGFQSGHHSAIDDARATLTCYKHYKAAMEKKTFSDDLAKLSGRRESYKKERPKYVSEKCSCVI